VVASAISWRIVSTAAPGLRQFLERASVEFIDNIGAKLRKGGK
jgi:hypothetical protein